MIFLGLDTEQASDGIEKFLTKAEPHSGMPQFDAIMAEAYALYEQFSDEERLWLNERADEIGEPTIN